MNVFAENSANNFEKGHEGKPGELNQFNYRQIDLILLVAWVIQTHLQSSDYSGFIKMVRQHILIRQNTIFSSYIACPKNCDTRIRGCGYDYIVM